MILSAVSHTQCTVEMLTITHRIPCTCMSGSHTHATTNLRNIYLVVLSTVCFSHTLTHSHIHTLTHSQYGQVAEEEHGSLHPRCLIRAHPRPLSREQTNPDTNFVYITVYCIYPQTAFIPQKIAVKILTALAIILCMCIQQI